MAGVTDRPFRQLCRAQGAGLAVSEMVSSNALLWGSQKTRRRIDHEGEGEPVSVQIAGAVPQQMAEAARFNVDHGAQIIDINMGCPAKKVCNVMAGSALLQDEPLVGRILDAVVAAVDVPVTLKIRTGWNPEHKNAVAIARLAEKAGSHLRGIFSGHLHRGIQLLRNGVLQSGVSSPACEFTAGPRDESCDFLPGGPIPFNHITFTNDATMVKSYAIPFE